MATITPTFSILIPTYNGADFLKETLDSLFNQTYQNFEVIINDDNSSDNTIKLLNKNKDPRLFVYQNKKNLGYPLNLQTASQKAKGMYLYLLGQDDLLSPTALEDTLSAFKRFPKAAAVTRPYYWFDNNPNTAIRRKKQLDPSKDTLLTIKSPKADIITMFSTLDQLSGLSYKRSLLRLPFHPDIFPCHIYPFVDLFKRHPVIFLKDYNTAVRISSSQTRSLSSIYNKSPILSWKQMVDRIFPKEEYPRLNNLLIKDFVARNYVGLVQIRNFSTLKNYLREVYYLVAFRPLNLLSPAFYLFSLGCLILPPAFLIPLTDNYKKLINSFLYKKVKLKK